MGRYLAGFQVPKAEHWIKRKKEKKKKAYMYAKGFKPSHSQMLLLCFAQAAVVVSVLPHTPCTPQTGKGVLLGSICTWWLSLPPTTDDGASRAIARLQVIPFCSESPTGVS